MFQDSFINCCKYPHISVRFQSVQVRQIIYTHIFGISEYTTGKLSCPWDKRERQVSWKDSQHKSEDHIDCEINANKFKEKDN